MVRPTSTVKPILPSHALGKLPAQRAPRTSHPPRKKASLMIFERTRASPLVSKEETPVNAIEDVAGQPRTNFGPFWVDKEHRQPTLSLYRSLLRVTGKRRLGEVSEGSGSSSQGVAQATSLLGIRGEIQKEWRRYRNLTSIPLTHSVLRKQVHLLSQISPSSSTSTTRLLELDQALLEKQQHRVARAEEIANRPRLRPRMQGGFLRPTINNVPLPRLRPQPPEIHGMISHRIKERERRISRRKSMVEMRGDMLREVDFWRKLATANAQTPTSASPSSAPPFIADDWAYGWDKFFAQSIRDIDDRFEADNRRRSMKYDQLVVEKVRAAKRRKEKWKRDLAATRKLVEAGKAEDVDGVDR